jgi:hypothetical protein
MALNDNKRGCPLSSDASVVEYSKIESCIDVAYLYRILFSWHLLIYWNNNERVSDGSQSIHEEEKKMLNSLIFLTFFSLFMHAHVTKLYTYIHFPWNRESYYTDMGLPCVVHRTVRDMQLKGRVGFPYDTEYLDPLSEIYY